MRKFNIILYIFIVFKNQRWLLFSQWHLKWIKSNFLLVTPAAPLAYSKRFVGTQTEKNKREKRKNKIGKKMSHSPFTRVCHCIPRGYTCPFFNCHRCYRSGRPILYILYSLWRWRRGDPTAACYCIIKYYTQIRLCKLSGSTWISKI